MEKQELLAKYSKIPQELKVLKRWVCFIVDEQNQKYPINPISGNFAQSNNDCTWSTFNVAINGCVKYGCPGIGFMLGNGIFGVDLDDGAYKKLKKGEITQEEYLEERKKFEVILNEFKEGLNSFSELSVSGKGMHIICYGKLPEGRRRSTDFEMYDSGRFFACTGNVVNNVPIQNREKEIIPFWEKYINKGNPIKKVNSTPIVKEINIEDEKLIELIKKSKQSEKFQKLMDGDMSDYDDDHSKADQALCNILAFWTQNDKEQMDRIFRTSELMRDKWDSKRGARTYGEIQLDSAISITDNVFTPEPTEIKSYLKTRKYINEETGELSNELIPNMNIDENGEPIFKIKKIFKHYTLDDTGNAQRLYDYFGELFHYNVTDKCFMFWTGKTWIKDSKEIIKKYANKLIDMMRDEVNSIQDNINKYRTEGDAAKANDLEDYLKTFCKNVSRLANKAGKEAMIAEFKALGTIPVESNEFDREKYLLNTDSGIINLENGDILGYDPKYMISKSTNCKVICEEPTTWISFLNSIFYRGDDEKSIQETKEIVEFVRLSLGYSLSGSCDEQIMFVLYGDGSNGKSTFTETVAKMMGDYAASINADVLMQQKVSNNSSTYTLAKLMNIRFVECGETEESGKLAEAKVKAITGGDVINAAFKYGNEFSYKPDFKIWMSTNNKPIIRGKDFGIWRRIIPIPFLRKFTAKEKDKKMPIKLKEEIPKILAWCIEGYLEYQEKGEIVMPKCLEDERVAYKEQMDVVSQFIKSECNVRIDLEISAKKLFNYYKMWAENNIEFKVKQTKFEEELLNRGIKIIRRRNEKTYKGIALIDEEGVSSYLRTNNYMED